MKSVLEARHAASIDSEKDRLKLRLHRAHEECLQLVRDAAAMPHFDGRLRDYDHVCLIAHQASEMLAGLFDGEGELRRISQAEHLAVLCGGK